MYKRLFRQHIKRTKRRLIRYTLLFANLALLAGVVTFVTWNKTPGTVINSQNALNNGSRVSANPLDQLSSADIAVHVARMTNLPEAIAVTNQADSENNLLAISSADDTVVAKPQVVSTALKSAKDISEYTSVEGDTIGGLATKFGVTSESIRHSNGLTSENIAAGTKLYIPPVNGLVYTVKSGDTPETLARKYTANKDDIIKDNDAEVSGLQVNQRILIRGGSQPVARTGNYSFYRGFAFGNSPIYGYNGYDPGWCTWHVAIRRAQVGKPVPANLGNAYSWDDIAARAGLPVSSSPGLYAVIVNKQGNHVGFVERMNDDGSIIVSDMNSSGFANIDLTGGRTGGRWVVSYRLVTPDQFGRFNFIL